MRSKTLCALPFHQISVMNDGHVRLCCRTERDVTSEGASLAVPGATLSQIWNSPYLRAVRHRMLVGAEVDDCRQCYDAEAGGATSLRQTMNAYFAWPGEGPALDDALARARALTAANGGHWPTAVQLWLGNRCNLQCRMCSPMFSSRIAGDPVQAQWWGGPRTARPSWSGDDRTVFEELLGHPECLRLIQFSGGEPLIHGVLPRILQRLVDAGHASHITLYIASNGTACAPRLAALLTRFAAVELAISVDGVGALQEYIRFPATWAITVRNALAFRAEGVYVSIRPTVQAYNVFGLLDVARWAGGAGLPLALDNVLWSPRFLSLDVLPPAVIDEARQEWEAYLARECGEGDRGQVRSVLAGLGRPRPEGETLAALQDAFIRFTNDLDRARGQDFARLCPRLHRGLTAAGLDFRGKYRFARAGGPAAAGG
jgi:hypothetical protein